MKISVIIPVFNSSKWLDHTINSVLLQPEVGQIILVDDGSVDDSLSICIKHMKSSDIVNVYYHPANANLGSAQTRNLGLSKAKCEFITFLDADDFFIENRFHSSLSILQNDRSIDGVYSTVQNLMEENYINKNEHQEILELKENVLPENLFYYIIGETNPYFSIIALLIRREKLLGISFDQSFRIGQDLDFIYQISLSLKLVKDNDHHAKIIRRLHDYNITNNHFGRGVRFSLSQKWFNTINNVTYSKKELWAITKNYFFRLNDLKGIFLKTKSSKIKAFMKFLWEHPYLIFKYLNAPKSVKRF